MSAVYQRQKADRAPSRLVMMLFGSAAILIFALVVNAGAGRAQKYTHGTNHVYTDWERVPEAELTKEFEERIKRSGKAGYSGEMVSEGNTWRIPDHWSPKWGRWWANVVREDVAWRIHFYSSTINGSNSLGWIRYGLITNVFALIRDTGPIIHDTMLLSKSTLLIVYSAGDMVVCVALEPSPDGGKMLGSKGTNQWYCYTIESPKEMIKRAWLRAESATNAVAFLVDESGKTNEAAWQGTAGWTPMAGAPSRKQ
jgi:hypothetical protein